MSFLNRSDFYLQRCLLELECKEVLVRLYSNFFTGSIDFISEVEIKRNLRDIGIVHEMIDENGVFTLNKSVLNDHKDELFCDLMLKWLDVSSRVAFFDEVFSVSFADPRKKRLVLTERLDLPVKSEVDCVYAVNSSALSGEFSFLKTLGLSGEFACCGSRSEFVGCPLWEKDGVFLVPVRNLVIKPVYEAQFTIMDFEEVTASSNNGVFILMNMKKYKGLVKGVLEDPLDVNTLMEVLQEWF